jgi:hypothetical protein
MVEGLGNVAMIFGIIMTSIYCALAITLLSITDFGEQKASRDVAIALVALTVRHVIHTLSWEL